MYYFILRIPGQPDEVARWKRSGAAMFYDFAAGEWVADALLAVELVEGDGWRPVEPSTLPAELIADDPNPQPPRARRSRRRRRQSSRSGLLRLFR